MSDENDQDPTLLTTVPSSTEAVILIGDLESLGIQAAQRASSHVGGIFGTPLRVDIYVRAGDVDRARAAIADSPSEEELLDAEQESEGG